MTNTETNRNKESSPPVVFLGFCERAAYVRQGNTNVYQWNILGLKHVVLSNIFPLTLSNQIVGIAVHESTLKNSLTLRLMKIGGREVGNFTMKIQVVPPTDETASLRTPSPAILAISAGWQTMFFQLPPPPITIYEPGEYEVILQIGMEKFIIGRVIFAVVDPAPLTLERVAAIRSNPLATKAVRITAKCSKCENEFRCYAGLERLPNLESQGYIWHADLPADFVCTCGAIAFNLGVIKRNIAGLLGREVTADGSVSFLPLYELGTLEHLHIEFGELLKKKPREEILQQFIEENPVLLHQFPAEEIYYKPPILTDYKADFGVLTPQREFILIEIEKTTTQLIKKDGGVSSDLQHAIDQVRNWLHIVDEHRVAALDSIGINREQVGSIKGVVIAGRDSGYKAEHLRRLKGTDWGRISLRTYDDILAGLAALIRQIKSL